MNRRSIDITSKGLGALAIALCLGLAHGPAAQAQARLTAQGAIDHAEIQDLLARYYWNFGGDTDNFGALYTKDAEMMLGPKSYKGIEAIKGAYSSMPKDIPQRKSYSFNVLMNNLLIDLHGSTATAQLVFTEVIIDKQGDAPRILTQGREFDHLTKQNGAWLISKRQIMGAADKPADWPK